jgi:hypothetical protein
MNLNRERLGLLADIRDGKVEISPKGYVFRVARTGPNGRPAQQRVAAAKLDQLRDAELVHPTLLELTDAGERALLLAGGAR